MENNYDLLAGEAYGFKWIVRHNGIGYRCGYVLLPDSHKWYNVDYDNIENISVHGGLTYARREVHDNETYWVVGFDCAHAGDAPDPTLTPERLAGLHYISSYATVKDTEYVRRECEHLCQQLSES